VRQAIHEMGEAAKHIAGQLPLSRGLRMLPYIYDRVYGDLDGLPPYYEEHISPGEIIVYKRN